MKRTPTRSFVARSIVVLMVWLAATGVLAASAFAATSYTNPLPAPNSTTALTTPAVKLTVTDPQGINTTSLIMKLDNLTVRGKWSGSTVTYQPVSAIANGTHTASVSVLNYGGVRSTYTWSFTVKAAPAIGTMAPADGSTVSVQQPTISVVVTPNGVGLASWTMKVDGAMVAAAWSPTTKTLAYTPAKALRNDAVHSVSVNVTDTTGAAAAVSFSFGVQIYPDMAANMGCVECHPTYPAAHPMTTCDNCHGYSGPIGGFYGPPDYHPDGEASLYLTDCTYCHGSNIYPTVPNHSDLTVAHGSTMDMTGCACHVRSITIEHNRWTDENGNALSCASCHGAGASQQVKDALAAGSTNCLDCHTLPTGHPYGEVDHVADVGDVVDSSGFTCGDCHAMDLATEHGKASSSSAGKTCVTCHPEPRDSFASWGQTCVQGGCHVSGSPAAVHAGAAAAHAFADPNASCLAAGCHSGKTDLTAMHASASTDTPAGTRTSCLVCHADGVPTTKACVDCHPDRLAAHGYDPVKHTATLGTGTVPLFSSHEFVGPVSYGVVCSDCHSAELGPVHASLCSTCHAVPRDSFASWSKNCSQAACHTTYHANSVAIHDAAASGNCGKCHDETNFDLVADPCGSCHEHYNPADATPPVTISDAKPSYTGAAAVRFSATDGGLVGIINTFYKLDGGSAVLGDVAVATGAGSHTLEFWSVDQNANAEGHHTVTFTTTADGTPPTTTSNAKSAYEVASTSAANITLTATDASTSGVKATYYTLNGGARQTGTKVSILPPASGTASYTMVFWSEDWSGNIEGSHTVAFTVTKDITPPTTSCDAISGATYTAGQTFHLTATDGNGGGVATMWYKLDGTTTYSWYQNGIPVPLPASGSVSHTISFYSKDNAGNQETAKSVTFTMSATATPPSAPTLINLPTGGSFDYETEPPPSVTLQWLPVTAPDGDPCIYKLELVTQSPYSAPFKFATATTPINLGASTSYTIAQAWGANYYWQVRAVDSIHQGLISPPSQVSVFTIFDGLYPYNSPFGGPYN